MLTSLSNLKMIQKTPIPYTTKMVELQNMGLIETTQMIVGTCYCYQINLCLYDTNTVVIIGQTSMNDVYMNSQ